MSRTDRPSLRELFAGDGPVELAPDEVDQVLRALVLLEEHRVADTLRARIVVRGG